MRIFLIVMLFAAVMVTPSAGQTFGLCVLEVNGKSYLSEPCEVDIDEDGSFTIGVSETERSEYFAYVSMNEDGSATGFWNGEFAESRAHDSLGDLVQDGNCWVNETAKVCTSY